MTLSLVWAFTIAVLTLPTALIATLHADRAGIAFYLGTMTASSLLVGVIFPTIGFRSLLLTIPPDLIVKPRLRTATAHLAPGHPADAPHR